LRATFLGLLANAVLASLKLATGVAGHSHALVADAVESLADVFSSLVVWRGVVIAAAPADEDHPYGHGKAEPIAAALVSGMLLLAAIWIGVRSTSGLTQPRPAPESYTLVVLLVVVVVKEGLFRFVRRESVSIGSTVVRADAWHHRSDAITSIAAAIGISVSLVAGKGYESADDVAALIAACIIAWNGVRLLRPALNELMDSSPSREVHDRIRAIAAATPEVRGVEKCLVRKMGYEYFVDLHVEVDPHMSVLHAHEVAHDVKDRIRAELPDVKDVLVHIEPAHSKEEREKLG
jgi:cation diffusion facilitator family transporter